MFTLKEIHFDGNNDLSKNITDELGNKLIISMKNLGINMRCHYLFQIVKKNLFELTTFIKLQQNKVESIDTIECNRLLYNFLDTFYAYLNYYEKNYEENFKCVKNAIYDNYFEYRFFYYLRNYVIHEDFAILRVSKYLFEDRIDVKFEIDNNALINSTSCKKSFKVELQNLQYKYTDLSNLLSNFYLILLKIHIEMLLKIWKDLRKDFVLLMDNIPNRQDVFLEKNDKIVNSLFNATTKYYKCVSNYFVYPENLLQEESVNKFFLDISFLYYKEKNVVYVGEK